MITGDTVCAVFAVLGLALLYLKASLAKNDDWR
jgi:hypothetical protein